MNQPDNVYQFDRQFDGTGMSPSQICDEVRKRGWAGMHMDSQRALYGDGKLIVERLSQSDVERMTEGLRRIRR